MSRRRNFALILNADGGEYQSGVVQGATDAASKQEVNLVIVATHWLDSSRTTGVVEDYIHRHVRRPTIDGVLVASGCLSHFLTPERTDHFFASFAPLPAVSISVPVPGIPSLVLDNRVAQKTIVNHLIEDHGCRRIAYIGGPAGSFEAIDRLAGYKEALEEHGVAFDPAICTEGNFWTDSAYRFTELLVRSGAPVDAIAAANDYMALGALDALRHHKIRVPEGVRVVGFDDIMTAKMSSPPLATVKQPLHRMGSFAVELLSRMLEGAPVEPVYNVDCEVTRRPSCGCIQRPFQVPVPVPSAMRAASLPQSDPTLLGNLAKGLSAVTAFPESHWSQVLETLEQAFKDDLQSAKGQFIRVLTVLLEEHRNNPALLEPFYAIVEALRTKREAPCKSTSAEELVYSAVLTISAAINRAHMRTLFDQNNAQINVGFNVERLSTVFTQAALSHALHEFLPRTAIHSSCIGLYTQGQPELMQALVVTGGDLSSKLQGKTYAAEELAPSGFFPTDRRVDFVVLPLTHAEVLYGQAVFEMGDHHSVYSLLREQIGATLKAIELRRSVIEATTRRERAEREMLERETVIAKQIQTAILPKRLVIQGLEIVAIMQPATSIGGDYYDVIPIEGGCFIGIGDVTGHGLLAGMIMLMLQSMISAAVRLRPSSTPAELLPALNQSLFDSTRERLQVNDHVTLTLIKYGYDGKLLLSGAHEDVLIYRKQTGQCERISSPGFWLAAIADVSPMTYDLSENLEPGDCLVLYTDGITESMNDKSEQFGLARLITTVETCADMSPQCISDTVLRALAAWTHSQTDDVTLLVAKYG